MIGINPLKVIHYERSQKGIHKSKTVTDVWVKGPSLSEHFSGPGRAVGVCVCVSGQ